MTNEDVAAALQRLPYRTQYELLMQSCKGAKLPNLFKYLLQPCSCMHNNLVIFLFEPKISFLQTYIHPL